MAGSLQPGRNPIIELAKLGFYCIELAGNILIKSLGFALFAALVPFIPGFLALLMVLWPVVAFFITLLFAFGITLAYYVPLIPYIVFTFAAVAWFITVIEAMAAAPIVALGIAHPEGHDTLGKADAAVLLLVSVFLRPSLMILGFVVGIIMSYVLVILLNSGFMAVSDAVIGFSRTNDSPGDFSGFAGLVAPFFMMGVYVSLYVGLIQASFSFIYILPDRVLGWIGAPGSGIGEQVAGQASSAVKGSVESTGKQIESGAKKGMQAAAAAGKSVKGSKMGQKYAAAKGKAGKSISAGAKKLGGKAKAGAKKMASKLKSGK